MVLQGGEFAKKVQENDILKLVPRLKARKRPFFIFEIITWLLIVLPTNLAFLVQKTG